MNGLRFFDPIINPLEAILPRFVEPSRLNKNKVAGMDIRVDIVEKGDVYQVRADLPGVKEEDINVRIYGNIVQIDAQTQDAKEFKENGGKVLRSERYYGSVSHTFSLADDVDESKIVAKYHDGVLSLELTKMATSKSGTKRIAIQ
jgi:HSP20 family protein